MSAARRPKRRKLSALEAGMRKENYELLRQLAISNGNLRQLVDGLSRIGLGMGPHILSLAVAVQTAKAWLENPDRITEPGESFR